MEYRGIVSGLGNPGPQYDRSRHNCGFMFLEQLLELTMEQGQAEQLNGKKFNCLMWRIALPGLEGSWLAVKPLTFMNNSGLCLQAILAWHKMAPDKLVVVHDELDIPPGEIRFKFGGGLAGHNGLASISSQLGSKDFYRLRIGIGKPADKENMISWVLGRPEKKDMDQIERIIGEAIETFLIFSSQGLMEAAQYARDISRKNRAS